MTSLKKLYYVNIGRIGLNENYENLIATTFPSIEMIYFYFDFRLTVETEGTTSYDPPLDRFLKQVDKLPLDIDKLRVYVQDQKEKIKYGSFELDVSKVCTEKPIQPKLSFIVMLSICTVMLLLGLIACIVMLFRKHKRKQRPFTMTTLVGQNPNLTIDPNLTMDPNALAIQNNQIPPGYLAAPIANNQQIMTTNQPPGTMMISNPQLTALQRQPPNQMMMQQHPSFRQHAIGSSRSEFENDFIGVFPNYHLSPCPDM